ncbi:aldo/keto reductase [Aerococcaceae bacterium zg-ZJ1578]|uniref:aldo/keto reductase n=1 Tax=Aerococcaceae bacterium zg-252 TaxID=2796928 RepID=UPI001A24EACA|nr:aldo/keto reductase [Aerococcaceae bacterium zg-1578]
MKTINIGKTPVKASQLAHGCMRMAALNAEETAKVIETAYNVGINFFDHADIYGGGQSETIFAQGLSQTAIQRSDVFLQSKVGIRKGFFDFSKEHIVSSVEQILSRLQTDYLDFLLLHRPDTLMEPEEVAAAFDTLFESGKVRYFGVSNQNRAQIELLQHFVTQPLAVNQLQFGPAHTPLIDEGLNVNMLNDASVNHTGGLLEFSRLHEMTIQPWSPFQVDLGQGLFMEHPKYQKLTTILHLYAKDKGVSFEAMVMAWIMRHPAKMQPIVGSMNPERIASMAQASEVKLSREEWYDIYRSAGNVLP